MKKYIIILSLLILICILSYFYFCTFARPEGFTLNNSNFSDLNINMLNDLGKYIKNIVLTYDPTFNNNSCSDINKNPCYIMIQYINFTMDGKFFNFNEYINKGIFNNLIGIDVISHTNTSDYNNSDFFGCLSSQP